MISATTSITRKDRTSKPNEKQREKFEKAQKNSIPSQTLTSTKNSCINQKSRNKEL